MSLLIGHIGVVTITILTCTSYLLLLAFKVVYNIWFHPLSNYPGPKYLAGFEFPRVLWLFQGSTINKTAAVHKKYGPVVRVAPNILSFATAQAWKDIYGFRQNKRQLAKDYKRVLYDEDKLPILFSNDLDHARIRKTMAHAFSETALREQEPLLKEHIARLISQLSKRAEQRERVDMNEWYNLIAFDVVSDLSFGESLDALQAGARHEFIQGFFSACRYQPLFVLAREYKPIGLLLRTLMSIPSFKRVQEMGYQSTKDKVLRRIGLKSDTRRDFMTYILKHNDKRGMSEFEIIGSTSVLVNAGGDTTAAALAAITFYLLKDPRVLKQAQDEVRRSFAHRGAITSTTLGQLTYLNAVIEEAFRIHPPTAGNFARRTGPEGDIIDGHFVPPDVSVGIHQWSATHSDANFHDPEKFVPERWLRDPPEQYRNDIKAASQPWSIGPRNCLGRNLAYLEIRSVLAHVLWSFDMALCDESRNWAMHQRFDIVWDRPPLYVELKGMR